MKHQTITPINPHPNNPEPHQRWACAGCDTTAHTITELLATDCDATPLTDHVTTIMTQRAEAAAALQGTDPDTAATIARRAAESAAAILTDPDHPAHANTAQALLDLTFGPHTPPPDWWNTPAGQACARTAASTARGSVTHTQAATMLGITKSGASNALHRGLLDPHPDGSIDLASVLRRVATKAAR